MTAPDTPDGPPQPVQDSGTEPTAPDAADRPNAWTTLLRMGRPRLTKAQILAAVLAVSLGFAIATQVHSTSVQGLESLREDELVQLLDQVQQDNDRLRDELAALTEQRDKLSSGVAGSAEARAAARERLDALGILSGTVAADGPGVTMVINDPKHGITAAIMLDAIEELRDAGAEAIQINDVRVVASTSFTDLGTTGIDASGETMAPPYTILAIGDAATIAAAMDIPGGVTKTVRDAGATITVSQSSAIKVTALHTLSDAQYARPVPPASATS